MSEKAQTPVTKPNLLTRIWNQWLTGHHASIQDIVDQRLARLASSFALAIAIVMIIGLFASSLTSSFEEAFSGFGPPLITTLFTYLLTRTRYYKAGVFLFTLGFGVSSHLSIMSQGAQANSGLILLLYVPISLIIASTFLSYKAVLLLTILFSGGAGYLTSKYSLLPSTESAIGVILAIGAILAFLSTYRSNSEQLRLKEIQAANQELEQLKNELEERVEERTKELEDRRQEVEMRSDELLAANLHVERNARKAATVSVIARQISTIRDMRTLLPNVSQLISHQFGFYHVGIFLLDERKSLAILSATNSPGGKKMLERNHRLKVGEEGIVGYVTSAGKPRIALNVGEDAVHFNNPDLPETRSEMAIPLQVGGEIIGALDIQDRKENAFSEDDIEILTTLADLVSIAIENARLFEESQQALAEAQAISRQYAAQEWQTMSRRLGIAGLQYNLTGSNILDEPIQTSTIQKAVEVGDIQVENDVQRGATLAVPIKLRDQVIGVLNINSPTKAQWNQDEIDIARAVAERVAISAENARLFEETNRRAERERMVSDISSKIRSTNNPQTMLQTALNELQKALGGVNVQINPVEKPAIKPKKTAEN